MIPMRCRLSFIILLLTAPLVAQDDPTAEYHATIAAAPSDSLVFEAYVALTEYYELEDTSLANRYLDTLRTLTARHPDSFYRGSLLFQELFRDYQRQRFRRALSAVEEADREAPRARHNLRYAINYYGGQAALRLKEYDTAISYYLRAYDQAKAWGNLEKRANVLNSIGNAHRRVKNLEEALGYFARARALYQEQGNLQRTVMVLGNQAIVRKNQGKLGLAESLYREALSISPGITDERERAIEEAYIHTNLGNLLAQQNRTAAARAEALAARDGFDRYGNPRERASNRFLLSMIALNEKRYGQAATYVHEANALGKEFPGITDHSVNSLVKIYKKAGNLDSLVHYMDVANKAELESEEKERIAALNELEKKYKSEQQLAEIDRLALEDELNQSRLTRQRYALMGGFLLAGVLGLFLFVSYRQRRKITAQNETIRRSLLEKDTLLKEIHHRVKNNLQMVSSLLSLQGDFIEDDAALDAIEMGRQRVRSMAIIHQRLYLRDEVSTDISARDYLDQLIGELMSTLNVNKDLALRLEKDLEDIHLDIDRLIPLGLVANEVITNAMKYAFTGRESGRLAVGLTREGEDILLRIADDGPGLKETFAQDNGSFGSLLIHTFTEQLEGQLMVDGSDGTEVRLLFPRSA